MYSRQNNVFFGLGLGLLIPMVFYFSLSPLIVPRFKARTLGLMAVCLNLILVQLFKKKRMGEALRGVVLSTVGMSLVWFIFFGLAVLNEE